MRKGAQLERLKQVRIRKADQAGAALASAQNAVSHWGNEHRKWSKAFEQFRAAGGVVIQEVIEEVKNLDDAYLMYQKVQLTLNRHRQAELAAAHRRDHAESELAKAQAVLETALKTYRSASGRKEAVSKATEHVVKREQQQDEAVLEDSILDDFAASLYQGAKP